MEQNEELTLPPNLSTSPVIIYRNVFIDSKPVDVYEVFISSIRTGKSIVASITRSTTVYHLLPFIDRDLGISPETLKLIFTGKQLSFHDVLYIKGVEPYDTVKVYFKGPSWSYNFIYQMVLAATFISTSQMLVQVVYRMSENCAKKLTQDLQRRCSSFAATHYRTICH